MAQRGKPSIAHVYDSRDCCIYCSMYKSNVDQIVHVCKPARELVVDKSEAEKVGLTVQEYRAGEQSRK